MRRLRRSFFARDAPVVAPDLLGKVLVVGECAGRITEVEAYMAHDPASHSFRGQTPRNSVMFGPAGHLYVYFTYGMHHCANVVTGNRADGQAVLIRAVQPLRGVELMVARRTRPTHIADGPGKLCQAFAIDLSMNGLDLVQVPPGSAAIGIFDDGDATSPAPTVTPRIGISVAQDVLWRWVLQPASQRTPAP